MITLILLVCAMCAIIGYDAGGKREIGSTVGMLLGLFLGIIGLIIVLVSPKQSHQDWQETLELDRKIINSYADGKSQNNTSADELEKWHSLKEKGIITEEEYQKKKSSLL